MGALWLHREGLFEEEGARLVLEETTAALGRAWSTLRGSSLTLGRPSFEEDETSVVEDEVSVRPDEDLVVSDETSGLPDETSGLQDETSGLQIGRASCRERV